MDKSNRLDFVLVQRGLCSGRDKAKELIKNGLVLVNKQKPKKAGIEVMPDDIIELCVPPEKYVGRGGLKLEKALNDFNISVTDMACADIGASTGGFTDCLLQRGARFVYAIDTGHDQLSPKLKNDKRVTNIENLNFRNATEQDIDTVFDFICCDVSFISLELILPNIARFLKENATAVALIKPQFEAGPENIGKKGVVKDKNIHADVIGKIMASAEQNGLSVIGLSFSPITGQNGNIEFLINLKKTAENSTVNQNDVLQTVCAAHNTLQSRTEQC